MVLFCRSCDAELVALTRPVRRAGGRMLRSVRDVRRGHIAAWCPACRLASEYQEA